ncbi:hypothetical protein [Ewingella americana]|uniref:hypothetical protein n=1 Tax=Ewingella americana TaxID=41202 RepID=UPI0012AE01C0|nr:hypothetical protein [Ewingella americana]MRT01894.1 hypothetical protein [Ewingella americana]
MEVATPGGGADVPIANQTTPGIVKGGDAIQIGSDGTLMIGVAAGTRAGIVSIGTGISNSNGEISMATASTTIIGGVKKAQPVADVQTIQVTDIESAGLAIAALGTTLSELMQSLRNSGSLEKS